MDKIIKSFIMEEKTLYGLKPEVNKAEIAMVKGAFAAVKDSYPEKVHVQIVRICCDHMIEAEKRDLASKMSFLAGMVHKELADTVSYDAIMKKEFGISK